ncbi:MAG: SprT-like domain-containing protein [Bacteriovoracia bacterium]
MTPQDQLTSLFWEINNRHFSGILPIIDVTFSGRLVTTGGQYFKKPKKRIQISKRYLDLENGWKEIHDTLGHEMVHYWLDFLEKPCGHTTEFHRKLRECGFQRYSRLTPIRARYLYLCISCGTKYYRRKKGLWSCGPCSGKKFNPRFKLELVDFINLSNS